MIGPLHHFVAAVHSPFDARGAIAPDAVAVQASFLAANGIRTAFITGTTGECHSLTCEERLTLYDAWASAGPAHGLAVIGHVGGNSIEDARLLARRARERKFAAISTLAPSYFKPAGLADLIDWCAVIAAEAPDLPFYYYDIPSMSGVSLPVDRFLVEAPARIPNLAGVKFTNLDLVSYRRCLDVAGGRFDLPWGTDEALLAALATGARGRGGLDLQLGAGALRGALRRLHARRSRRGATPAIDFDRNDRRDRGHGLHGDREGVDVPARCAGGRRPVTVEQSHDCAGGRAPRASRRSGIRSMGRSASGSMIRTSLAAVLVIAAVSSTPAGRQDTAAPVTPVMIDVFVAGEGGYHTYRIPSAIVTPKGALLAFAEGRRAGAGDAGDIDLVLRRSRDGGRSWTPMQVIGDNGPNTFGNPCAVVDTRTNTIWLLITQNRGTDREKDIIAGTSEGGRTVWAMRSQDDGATWSTPVEITASVKAPEWTWYATGPGVGVQLRSGRLVSTGKPRRSKDWCAPLASDLQR